MQLLARKFDIIAKIIARRAGNFAHGASSQGHHVLGKLFVSSVYVSITGDRARIMGIMGHPIHTSSMIDGPNVVERTRKEN